MTPTNGRQTRNAPIRIASTALSKVHIKPGTFLVVNRAASPTNPLVRNSHPANVTTTSVAIKGAAAAETKNDHNARDQEQDPMTPDGQSQIVSKFIDICRGHNRLLIDMANVGLFERIGRPK